MQRTWIKYPPQDQPEGATPGGTVDLGIILPDKLMNSVICRVCADACDFDCRLQDRGNVSLLNDCPHCFPDFSQCDGVCYGECWTIDQFAHDIENHSVDVQNDWTAVLCPQGHLLWRDASDDVPFAFEVTDLVCKPARIEIRIHPDFSLSQISKVVDGYLCDRHPNIAITPKQILGHPPSKNLTLTHVASGHAVGYFGTPNVYPLHQLAIDLEGKADWTRNRHEVIRTFDSKPFGSFAAYIARACRKFSVE